MGAGSLQQTADTDKHTSLHEGKDLTFAVSHMCGWRQFMEDAHLAVSPLSDENNSLFAVFDGHGGAQVAIFAQRNFVHELETNQNYHNQNYELALRETFFKIDELIKTEAGKLEIRQIQNQQNQIGNGCVPSESHAGCTANVWLITPSEIYVANAGDSRGVLSVNKKCQQTSKDHKPTDELELKRITKAGGQVTIGRVNGNINLSRALGDFQFKQNTDLPAEEQMITANPDVTKFKNENIEFAIIGCDGIWEKKSCEEMVGWVAERIDKKPLGQILQELFDELVAKERTGQAEGTDNMSAILIRFQKQAKTKTKKNDQIDILLQKYFIQKDKSTTKKVFKHKGNDEICKLLSSKYLQ